VKLLLEDARDLFIIAILGWLVARFVEEIIYDALAF
jgi:hypothetical protein